MATTSSGPEVADAANGMPMKLGGSRKRLAAASNPRTNSVPPTAARSTPAPSASAASSLALGRGEDQAWVRARQANVVMPASHRGLELLQVFKSRDRCDGPQELGATGGVDVLGRARRAIGVKMLVQRVVHLERQLDQHAGAATNGGARGF